MSSPFIKSQFVSTAQYIGIAIVVAMCAVTYTRERHAERDAFRQRADRILLTFNIHLMRALVAIGESAQASQTVSNEDFCAFATSVSKQYPYVIAVLRHGAHEPSQLPSPITPINCISYTTPDAQAFSAAIWINYAGRLAPRLAAFRERLGTRLETLARRAPRPAIAALEMPEAGSTGHFLALLLPRSDGQSPPEGAITSAVIDPVALLTELRKGSAYWQRVAVSIVSRAPSLPLGGTEIIPSVWCLFACGNYSALRAAPWGDEHWSIRLSEAAPSLLDRYGTTVTVAVLGLLLLTFWQIYTRRTFLAAQQVSNMVEQREQEMWALNQILIEDIERRKRIMDELTRSRAQLRQLTDHNARVKEEERKRIAREIHDDLGQSMMVLRIDLSLIAKSEVKASTQVCIQHALAQIDQTVTAMRLIINELRPAVLDLGLDAAVEWESRKFTRRSGIPCTLDLQIAGVHLSDELSTAFYRIAQESLTNIMRHAKANSTAIHLWVEKEWLFMKICDDGIGIQEKACLSAESFGLIGIAERIFALGGAFNTESAPGQGTKMLIAAPLVNVHRNEQTH